jgi:hypothetical protein
MLFNWLIGAHRKLLKIALKNAWGHEKNTLHDVHL